MQQALHHGDRAQMFPQTGPLAVFHQALCHA
jgi:hypothetical protein